MTSLRNDDKIIIRARELGVSPTEHAEMIMKKIDRELDELKIEKSTIQSKATECILDMIMVIDELIKKYII